MLTDPLSAPSTAPFLLWLLQLIQEQLEETEVSLRMPLEMRWIPLHPQLQTRCRVQASGSRSIMSLLRSAGWTQCWGQRPPGASLPHTAPLPARAHPGTAGIGQMSPGNLCLHVPHSSMGTSSNRARSIHPAVIETYSQVFNMHAGPSCSLRLAGIQQGFDGWLWQKTRVLIFLLSWNSFEAEAIILCDTALTPPC